MTIVYKRIEKIIPSVGDLIRSENTPNYINIVLEVSDVKIDSTGAYVYVRSVRWVETNSGSPIAKYGKRSRWIRMGSRRHRLHDETWCIVEAVKLVKYDDLEARMSYINLMAGVDTTYREKKIGNGNSTQGTRH